MAGVYGEIGSRKVFFEVLDEAIAEARAILSRNPGEEVARAILGQLEAIRVWSAHGRTPTKAERDSIDLGLRASREYEGQDDRYSWTRRLYALDSYFTDWPSDEHAANATDDDFWEEDDT